MGSVPLLVKHLSLRSGASLPNDREQWLNLMFCERAFRRACRRSLLASSKSTSQTARRLCVDCMHLHSTQLVGASCSSATRLMACQNAQSCIMTPCQLFHKNIAAGVCSCVSLMVACAGCASMAQPLQHCSCPDYARQCPACSIRAPCNIMRQERLCSTSRLCVSTAGWLP